MKKKEMNSKDLLLSFLYSPGQKENVNEPIIGSTKLTKMMYLFEKEVYPCFFKDEIKISTVNELASAKAERSSQEQTKAEPQKSQDMDR